MLERACRPAPSDALRRSRGRPDDGAARQSDEERGHGEGQGGLGGGGGGVSEAGLEEDAGGGATERSAEMVGGVEDS